MNYLLLLITCILFFILIVLFIGALCLQLKVRKILNSYLDYGDSDDFVRDLCACWFSQRELEEIEKKANELNSRDYYFYEEFAQAKYKENENEE